MCIGCVLLCVSSIVLPRLYQEDQIPVAFRVANKSLIIIFAQCTAAPPLRQPPPLYLLCGIIRLFYWPLPLLLLLLGPRGPHVNKRHPVGLRGLLAQRPHKPRVEVMVGLQYTQVWNIRVGGGGGSGALVCCTGTQYISIGAEWNIGLCDASPPPPPMAPQSGHPKLPLPPPCLPAPTLYAMMCPMGSPLCPSTALSDRSPMRSTMVWRTGSSFRWRTRSGCHQLHREGGRLSRLGESRGRC